ncbi:MAG: hypothetical protein JOZ48_18595, partial [Acidobacteriaceae bacterium]|nr:hypothetical protein [Acidobacteriaceae bacterium]
MKTNKHDSAVRAIASRDRKRGSDWGPSLALVILLALPFASSAQVKISEYPIPAGASSNPEGITVGPDGAMWFAEASVSAGNAAIGRIDRNGNVTQYSLPANSQPQQLVTGPDGNLYFTVASGNFIGQLVPTSGTITQFAIPTANASPTGITVGPDGNIWFLEAAPGANSVASVSTAGAFSSPIPIPTSNSIPTTITLGPDHNVWFTEQGSGKIGTVRSGSVTEYTVTSGSEPFGITPGPDGNLWFTERNNSSVAKITTSGVVTEYSTPTSNSAPFMIVTGPDGALWFAEEGANNIGR